MNPFITAYFDDIESLFISNGIVHSFHVMRRQVSVTDGKYRIKLTFINRSEAEFFCT